jgi:CubicO group peptidase (beta-lactamase class C family)
MKPSPVSRRRFLWVSTVGVAALAVAPRTLRAAAVALPRTREVLAWGMERGLHIGAQIYVSREGRTVADFGIGEAKPGVKMTADTLMTWYSSTKPLTSLCVGQCWERGLLQLDDPVAKYVPEFAKHGKDKVTLRHVLTHTSGFPNADIAVRFKSPWKDVIAAICDAKLEPNWEVGRHAQYHPTSGMQMLGEVVARVSGMPFDRYIRTQLFEPLGMKDSWVGMPADVYRNYGDRMGTMMNTDGSQPVPAEHYSGIGQEGWATICVPGGNGHGPMRELARFYAMMLGRGELDGKRVVSAATVAEFTKVQRADAPNYQGKAGTNAPAWGLGISRQRGVGGVHSSAQTFGHGGSLSSLAFCDPEHRVVAAFVCNGRPKQADHAARVREITAAIYQDLGLAKA